MTSNALILRFGTDLAPLKQGMQEAGALALPVLTAISTGAIAASKNLVQLGGSAATAASAISRAASLYGQYKLVLLEVALATAAVSAVMDAASVQAQKLLDIANGSKAAGVGSTFFQQWEHEAARAGIAAKDAEVALVHAREAVRPKADSTGGLASNDTLDLLGEMALGKGVAGKGYGQFKDSTDVEGRVRAVIQAIRDLDAAAKENPFGNFNLVGDKLAEMVFGSQKFADQIRSAKSDTDALAIAGTTAGNVFDEALVRRARDIDDRVRDINNKFSDDMRPLLQDLGALGLSMREGWVDILASVERVVATTSDWYVKLRDVGQYLQTMRPPSWMQGAADRAGQAMTGLMDAAGVSSPGARADAGARMEQWLNGEGAGKIANPRGVFLDPSKIVWPGSQPSGTGIDPFNGAAPLPVSRPPPSTLAARAASPSGGGKTPSADEVERYLDSLKKSVAVLEAEVAAYGKSNVEKAKGVDLARAEEAARQRGTPLTQAERAEIDKLASSYGHLQDLQAALEKTTASAREQAQFFGNTMLSALEAGLAPGAKLKDVLSGVISSLEKASLQALIMGQGPLASLFGMAGSTANGGTGVGGLFGFLSSALPKFADGGVVGGAAGSPQLVIAHAGETILNAAQQGNVAAAMSRGAVTVHNYSGAPVQTRRDGNGDLLVMVGQMIRQSERRQNAGALANLATAQARKAVS